MLRHSWNITPSDAVVIQKEMRSQVSCHDQLPQLHRVAGVDVGFERNGKITRAAVAVLSYPDLQLIEQSVACLPSSFPYLPGLLSFRELPAILQAIEQLQQPADILLCDGPRESLIS
ncbi:MAG: endonuclease V [Candidatus Thiodiazotropha sp. (ex Ustalcina ferruginea)]|nr:endonuclease V [Candidatus Thiodiazotropha sp. (ex Ustalcina ferruginea)]